MNYDGQAIQIFYTLECPVCTQYEGHMMNEPFIHWSIMHAQSVNDKV